MEEVLEPRASDRAIPHHHLWDHPRSRYLLDELLADTGSGHHIAATVFVECMSMYRADGPDEMRPVGETEFVNGVAAMSASGRYGATRVAAGIVGFADLTLGERVGAVLDAHLAASAPLSRHPSRRGLGRERRRPQFAHEPAARPAPRRGLPPRLRASSAARGLSFDAWLYHPQLAELDRSGAARSPTPRSSSITSAGRSASARTRAGAREIFAGLEGRDPERSPTARTWSPSSADSSCRSTASACTSAPRRSRSIELADATRALVPARDRLLRSGALHVREQLPGGQGELLVPRCSGTRSSGSPPASRPPRRRRCSTTRPRGPTGCGSPDRGRAPAVGPPHEARRSRPSSPGPPGSDGAVV